MFISPFKKDIILNSIQFADCYNSLEKKKILHTIYWNQTEKN